MSSLKIAEDVKVVNMFFSERLGAATIFYNGSPVTTAACMVDTRDYESALVILNLGTQQGAAVSLLNTLVHSASNNPMTAIAITSGAFTTRTRTDTGNEIVEASVLCRDTLRYIALKTEVQAAISATIDMSAICVLGQPDSRGVSKTLEIDV